MKDNYSFEFAQINENSTIEEVEREITRLTILKESADNMQMALKIFINSAYGAMANQYFLFFNANVAEAVTLQCQHLIKSTKKTVNKYVNEKWHTDTELHKKLGVSDVKKLTDVDTIIYIDTDSIFFHLDPLIKSCNYTGDPIQFANDIDKYRIHEFFTHWHDVYAKKYNVPNLQDFEFEKFSYNALWLAKKNYVLHLATKGNKKYKKLEKFDYKGIKIVRGDTPLFAKDKLVFFLNMLFETEGNITHDKLLNIIIGWKNEYQKTDANKISYLKGITDYQKYVVSDTKGEKLQLRSRIPIHTRAAATYNYYLNNNIKHKNKYELIKSKDKVRYYYNVPSYDFPDNIFGFLVNEFPYEFAPEVDYKEMFGKTIIDPINKFLVALKIKQIPMNLTRVKKLF